MNEINDEETKIYDANAEQRFGFIVRENGQKFETAHVFKPINEERYLQYIKAVDIEGNDTNVVSKIREASAMFWDDLIIRVENIDVEENQEWKPLIDIDEKLEALNSYLAVAVVDTENISEGKRSLVAVDNQTVVTEAFLNGIPAQQKHIVKTPTLELKKKFDRIQQKQWKTEETKGLRRKPNIKYVPQAEGFAALYDQIFVSQTGFANSLIPIRFKTAVIDNLFAAKIDIGEKK